MRLSLARRCPPLGQPPLAPLSASPYSSLLRFVSVDPFDPSAGLFSRSDRAQESRRWEKYMGDRDLDRAYKTCPRRSQNYPLRIACLRSIPQITAVSFRSRLNRWLPHTGSIKSAIVDARTTPENGPGRARSLRCFSSLRSAAHCSVPTDVFLMAEVHGVLTCHKFEFHSISPVIIRRGETGLARW